MNLLLKNLSSQLADKGIRPSFQRIKVLEYLINRHCHPTVDQIYKDLQGEIPTLSKTTIYNTLNLFVKAGLVKLLTTEDTEARYDIITEPHGHFKCDECGSLFDFNIDLDSIEYEELTGFKVTDRNVYFKGICPKCLLNINHYERRE